MGTFISVFRRMPAEGEPFREFRNRLKKADLWSRERLPRLLRFMRLAHADPMVPSDLVLKLAALDEDRARDALADRLWDANPLLFTFIFQRLGERVHSANELLKYVDSFAYPGVRITGPELRNWIQFAQGLELFKPVGIRLALDARAKRFEDRVLAFDTDEFLEEDQDEPAPVAASAPAEDAEDGPRVEAPPVEVVPIAVTVPPEVPAAPAAPVTERRAAPVSAQRPAPSPAAGLPSPLGRGPAVLPRRFAGHVVFPDDVLAETRERVAGWWAAQPATPGPVPGAVEFGLDAESFFEDPERALFEVAVAAALAFRLRRPRAGVLSAFAELRDCGALAALYGGTTPEEPPEVGDAQALMLASLVARRCAEHPDLAASLERLETARAVFEQLEGSLGRGLFGVELFWIVRTLGTVGFLRLPDLGLLTAIPDRGVRDTLYRLGFLPTPYAANAPALAEAAAAARRAVGDGAHPDEALAAFAAAAGCAYGCPHRRRCDLPCRERADLG